MNTFTRALPVFVAAALTAVAQTSSSSTTPSSTTRTTTAPAATTAAPPASAPAATTATPPVSAPNAVVQPALRPVEPPVGNPPQVTPGAINPLAPNLPNPSNTAPGVVSSTPAPGAVSAGSVVVEPTNINELAAAGVDVSLNPTAALTTIRQAPVANQQPALRSLQTRVDATARALIDLRAQARANGVAGAGTNFDQAAEDIRVREAALRDAINSAGSTTDEAAWRQAQTQLATLYQAYADSVQRARSLLQPAPQP